MTASLACYQRSVAAALRPGAAPADAATEVIRTSVWRWARLQLISLCPLTTTALDLDGRLDREVTAQLARPDRPAAIHPWAREFLLRLSGDADEVVAAAAHFELACTAPGLLAERHPHGWWSAVEPAHLAAALLTGHRPPADPARGAWLRLVPAPGAPPAAPRWDLVRLDAGPS